MNLLHAWRTLIDAADTDVAEPDHLDPIPALVALATFAHEEGQLVTSHAWELAPHVCRELHQRFGYTPVGSWSRLAGLAAGTAALDATSCAFEPNRDPVAIARAPERYRKELLEAFTRRLIPPAAAAALYVSLDVHPVWGLRLGRRVGAIESDAIPAITDSLLSVEELVFGTLSILFATLRGLRTDRRYPVDALGDVLWCAGSSMTEISDTHAAQEEFPPPFVGSCDPAERRLFTTRMSIVDILDYVLIPAGAARRDEEGWFTVRPERLHGVQVGPFDPAEQEEWLSRALWGTRRAS